jgi:hypothetical protein
MDKQQPTNLQKRLFAFRVHHLAIQVQDRLNSVEELGLPVLPEARSIPEVLFRWAVEIADGQEYLP